MQGADQIAILLRCMYGVDRITIHMQLKSQKNFAKSLKSSALPKFIIDVAPINLKFGTGERRHGGADLRSAPPVSAPPCRISRLLRQKCGNTAPKTVKISTFGHKFAP